MLRFLDWQNISVATAIPDMEGRFIQRVRAAEGERWIVLFGEAKGRVRPVNANRSFRLGQAVARIHNCTDQQERDGRRFEHNFEDLILNCPNSSGNKLILNGRDPLPTIEPFLKHRKADFDYLVGVGEHLSRKIKGYHQKTAPWFGVCHGDLHRQNVHFDEDDNITLFDFDITVTVGGPTTWQLFSGISSIQSIRLLIGVEPLNRSEQDTGIGFWKGIPLFGP